MNLTATELNYCHTVIEPGSRLYYATRFLASAHQSWQLPLYVFYEILQKIPDDCSDPGVARMKLHWWTEQLNDLSKAANHPLLSILARQRDSFFHDKNCFAPLIQACLHKLTCDHFIDQASYDTHHLQARGALTRVIAQINGKCDDTLTHQLAKSINLSHRVLSIGLDKQKGRCLLPPDLIAQHGVSADLAATPALHTVLTSLQQQAQSCAPAWPHMNKHHPLFAEYAYYRLSMATIALVDNDKTQLLNQHITLSPLRQCWLAWRLS